MFKWSVVKGLVILGKSLLNSLTREYCEQNERRYTEGPNKNEPLLKGPTKMRPYWRAQQKWSPTEGVKKWGATEGATSERRYWRAQQKYSANEVATKMSRYWGAQQKYSATEGATKMRDATEVATSERCYWGGNKWEALLMGQQIWCVRLQHKHHKRWQQHYWH